MCNQLRCSRISILSLLAVVLAGSLLSAVPAAAGTSVSVTVTTNDPKTMAGLLIGGIMGAFFSAAESAQAPAPPAPAPVPAPAPPPIIVRPAPQPADPWAELPYWYVASYADVPVERIMELRQAGRDWVEIVDYYRLPQEFRGRQVIMIETPSGKVKVKVRKIRPVFVAYSDEEFERFVFVRFLEEYYSVPRTTVVVWLNRGLSLQDVFLSVNLATRVRVQPETVIRRRLVGEPWEVIARRYRVDVAELGRPVVIERLQRRNVRFDHGGDQNDDEDGNHN